MITHLNQRQATASAIITTPQRDKMLLILHHKLQVWLQPGGHQKWNETPWDTAMRECLEETGLDISAIHQYKVWDDVVRIIPQPFIIQEQRIPAYKDQPEHFHIDSMYLIELPEQPITPETPETRWAWMTLSEIQSSNQMFENLQRLAQKVLGEPA